jgi:hypothetical protein
LLEVADRQVRFCYNLCDKPGCLIIVLSKLWGAMCY